jgi:O-antigen/teichoic acid export membrane protein
MGNYLSYFRTDGDNLLVTLLLGPAALAEYYVAKTLYTNMGLILAAADRVGAERLARHVGTENFRQTALQLHEQISSILIPFALFAVAVAPEALVVLAGPRYAGASWPATILLVVMLVQFVAIPFDRIVYVAVPGWVRFKFTFIEAVLAAASVVVLAPIAGLIGVAAARIIAPLGVCAFGAWIIFRHLEFSLPLKSTLRGLVAALPATCLALAMTPPIHSLKQAILMGMGAAAIWTLSFIGITLLIDRRSIADMLASARQKYLAILRQ